MSDTPDEKTVASIIVICRLLGKETVNANTVIQKFEAVMKEMKEHRKTEERLRNLSGH